MFLLALIMHGGLAVQAMEKAAITPLASNIAFLGKDAALSYVNELEHKNRVIAVCFSPNNKLIATAAADERCFIWDAQDGKILQELTGHLDAVNSLSFSADGKTLAGGSADKMVYLWDTQTWKLKSILKAHTACVEAVCFGPGKLLASGSHDKSIILWDVEKAEEIKRLTDHDKAVLSIAFNGTLLASGSADGNIRVWQLEERDFVPQLLSSLKLACTLILQEKISEGPVSAVDFNKKTNNLFASFSNTKIGLWNPSAAEKNKKLIFAQESGHEAAISSLQVSPQGDFAATAAMDGAVKLWNLLTGTVVCQLKKDEGHEGAVKSIGFSADNKHLATASWDKTVRIWRLPQPR